MTEYYQYIIRMIINDIINVPMLFTNLANMIINEFNKFIADFAAVYRISVCFFSYSNTVGHKLCLALSKPTNYHNQ